MNNTILGALIVAGVTVIGNIAAMLALVYRIGRLTGTVEARLNSGDVDRANIWQQIGTVIGKLDRHMERGHGG